VSNTSGWELLGRADRQPDWGEEQEPEGQEAPAPETFAWIIREDRPAAAEFVQAHEQHGEVRHAKHAAGHHVLACLGCREFIFVDVPIGPRFDGLPIWPPPAAEEGPKFGIDDVIAGLRAVDQRLRRVEQELRRAGA
jgi:hypothetical protein